MTLSSERSFLKPGLFLGSYCQQLLIILEISTGQFCGADIRYPETQKPHTGQTLRRVIPNAHHESSPLSTSSRVCWLDMLV